MIRNSIPFLLWGLYCISLGAQGTISEKIQKFQTRPYSDELTTLSAEIEQAVLDNDLETALFKYSIRDSILIAENKVRLDSEQYQFDIETDLLNTELLENKVSRDFWTMVGLSIIIGLLLLTIYGSYFLWRQSKNFSLQLQKKVLDQTNSLKVMNEKLIHNNNELKKFSHIASHDIKEPIRNIGSFVKLIKRKLPEDQLNILNPYFEIINNSCGQIYTLIEDIMQYTKLGNIETIPIEPIDLSELVDSIQSNLSTFIKEKNASIKYYNLETIQSNKSLLFIILKNLIENGIKYNESEEPTITISYNLSDYGHELHVKDNGIGISKEYRHEIFELFTRLHTRNEYDGTGLGLSIVESCLNKLGGVIQLKSEIDLGSKFTIVLPIRDINFGGTTRKLRPISKSA